MMKRFSLLVLASLLGLLAAPLSAADPSDVNRPSEEEAIAAWEKAGARHRINRKPRRGMRPDAKLCEVVLSGDQVTDDLARYLTALRDTTYLLMNGTQITDKSLQYIGQLPNLKTLMLESDRIDGRGIKHLASCKKLKFLTIESAGLSDDNPIDLTPLAELQLGSLRLGGPNAGDATFATLSKLQTLTEIDVIPGTGPDGEPLVTGKTLRAFKPLPHVIKLKLGGDRKTRWNPVKISDDDVALLAEMPHAAFLALSTEHLTDRGMEHLGRCQWLEQLEIWHAPITDQGLEKLSKLRSLTVLHLYGTQVTGVGLRAWAHVSDDDPSPIRNLVLVGDAVNDKGMLQVAKLRQLGVLYLGYLDIFHKQDAPRLAVTEHGVRMLRRLPNLQWLWLGHINFSDVGLEVLSGFPSLVRLQLYDLPITDEGLAKFTTDSAIRSVRFVDCHGLTRAGLQQLSDRVPSLRIEVFLDGRPIGYLGAGQTGWLE